MDDMSGQPEGGAAGGSPARLLPQSVDALLEAIPEADGAAVELLDGAALTVVCARGQLAGLLGTKLPAEHSTPGYALAQRRPLRSAEDDRVEQELRGRGGSKSLVHVPLYRDGAAVGVLTLCSSRPTAFSHTEDSVLTYLGRLVGAAIDGWADRPHAVTDLLTDSGSRHDSVSGRQLTAFITRVLTTAGNGRDRTVAERIEQLIAQSTVRMLFQPIIDLKTGALAGAEALARFPQGADHTTEHWFIAAQREGLGLPLQLLTVTAALHHLPALPPRAYLAINVDHHVATSPELLRLLTMIDASRIVIELTEHQQVTDYDELAAAAGRLRDSGARLAIDDTGAGFAGFSHILKLSPDLIKLDRILTTGIDSDPARQALGEALAGFAAATGASVIAEGIETPEELDAIRQLGIGYGQGYLLGRPAPPADIAHSAVRAAAQLARPLSRRILP